MAKITVTTGEAPYGTQRPYTMMRFVLAALSEGHGVNLFLFEDAVAMAKKGQKTPDFPGVLNEKMPNAEELLAAGIKAGAVVRACGVCCQERAIKQEEMIEGAVISGMKDLVEWVAESDKVVSF